MTACESLSAGLHFLLLHNAERVDLLKASAYCISCSWPITFMVQFQLLIKATHLFMTVLLPLLWSSSYPLPSALFQETQPSLLTYHAPHTSRSIPLPYDLTSLFN